MAAVRQRNRQGITASKVYCLFDLASTWIKMLVLWTSPSASSFPLYPGPHIWALSSPHLIHNLMISQQPPWYPGLSSCCGIQWFMMKAPAPTCRDNFSCGSWKPASKVTLCSWCWWGYTVCKALLQISPTSPSYLAPFLLKILHHPFLPENSPLRKDHLLCCNRHRDLA